MFKVSRVITLKRYDYDLNYDSLPPKIPQNPNGNDIAAVRSLLISLNRARFKNNKVGINSMRGNALRGTAASNGNC